MPGLANLASFAYRAAPQLWRRISEDMQRPIEPAANVLRTSLPGPATGLACHLGSAIARSRSPSTASAYLPTLSSAPESASAPGALDAGHQAAGRALQPALADLPTPDLSSFLLSHAHMDHFDLPSLRKLQNRGTTVVTAVGTSDGCGSEALYAAVRELRWNETTPSGSSPPCKLSRLSIGERACRRTRTGVTTDI